MDVKFIFSGKSNITFASRQRRQFHRFTMWDILSRRVTDPSKYPSKKYKACCLAAKLLNNLLADSGFLAPANEWFVHAPVVRTDNTGRKVWTVGLLPFSN